MTRKLFSHSFFRYDINLLVEKLETKAKIVARNQEKFRTLSIGRFQIKDSLEHIPSSLDALVSDLCKDDSFDFPLLRQFEIVQKLKQRKRVTAVKLLKRKGVYPYEYFSSFEHITNSCAFPSRKSFYSTLNDAGITAQDYQHGKKVFVFFQCRTMEDYMKLYCGLDVNLLAEVFVKYWEMVLHHFKLDPIYYLGTFIVKNCRIIFLLCCFTSGIPGLSFDIMLKMYYEKEKTEGKDETAKPTGSLDLLHDPDMEQFFNNGIRGGQSFISTRRAKGNEDPKMPGDHLLYVDGE